MIVRSLKMNNFRSYIGEKTIQFDTGITVVIGENGSGKSSMMDAIDFALFRDNEYKPMEIMTLGNKKMDVSLEFRCDRVDYRVYRSRQGSKSEDMLYEKKDGKWILLTRGKVETNAEIINVLGIGKDIYRDAIYIRQGEIDRILADTKDRKVLVGKILGIDRYEKAWTAMGKSDGVIGVFQGKIDVLTGEIQQKDEVLKEQQETIEKIKIDELLFKESQAQFLKESGEKDKRQIVLEAFDKNEKEYIRLSGRLTSADMQFKDKSDFSTQQNEQLNKIVETEVRNIEIEPKVKNLEILGHLKANITQITQDLKDLTVVDDKIKKIADWKATLEACNIDFTTYERLNQDCKTIEGYRPKLDKSINKIIKHNEDLANIARWKSDMERLSSSFNEYEAVDDILDFLNKQKTRIGRAMNDIRSDEEQLKKIGTWRTDISTYEDTYNRFELLSYNIKLLSEKKYAIGVALNDHENCLTILKEIQKYKKALGELKPEYTHYLEVKADIELKESGARDLRESYVRYKALQTDIQQLSKKISVLEKNIKKTVENYCKYLKIDVCSPSELKAHMTSIIDANRSAIALVTENREKHSATIEQLKGNKKAKMDSIASLEELDVDQCPTCGNDLSEEKKEVILSRYRGEVETFQRQISSMERKNRAMKKELSSLEEERDEIQGINIDLLSKSQDDRGELVKEKSEKEAELEPLKSIKGTLENLEKDIISQKSALGDLETEYNAYIASEQYLAGKDEAATNEELNNFALRVKEIIQAINEISGDIERIPDITDRITINTNIQGIIDTYTSEQSIVKDGHDRFFVANKNLAGIDEEMVKADLENKTSWLSKDVERINLRLGDKYAIVSGERFSGLIPSIDERSRQMADRIKELKDAHNGYITCKKNIEDHDEENIKNKLLEQEKKLDSAVGELNSKLIDLSKKLVSDKNIEFLNVLEQTVTSMKNDMDSSKANHDKYAIARDNLDNADEEITLKRREELGKDLESHTYAKANLIEELGYEPENVDMEYDGINKLNIEYQRNLVIIGDKPVVMRNISEVKAKMEELLATIASLKQTIEGLKYDVEEHKKAREAVKQADEVVKQTKGNIDRCSKQIEMSKEQVTKLDAKLEAIVAKEKELECLRSFLELLYEIRGIIHKDQLQNEIRKRSIPAISVYANELFSLFNLPYDAMTINEDYSITLHGIMGDYNTNMMSGGEKIAAALALRVGIARALMRGNLEMLILDEPTVHLDEERRRELASIIKNLISIPQTIVVTHDEEFDQAANTVIRVKKENGASVIDTS